MDIFKCWNDICYDLCKKVNLKLYQENNGFDIWNNLTRKEQIELGSHKLINNIKL